MSEQVPNQLDFQQLTAGRCVVRTRWMFIGAVIGAVVGFLAGQTNGWQQLSQTSVATSEPNHPSIIRQINPPRLISKYREEVLRLTRSRVAAATTHREKELLLQELERRGINAGAQNYRRLQREMQQLKLATERTDERLARVQERLSDLTAIGNPEDFRAAGLQPRDEIDARRIILQHKAGLQPHRGL